jgi:carboxypeptidase Q
MLIFGGKHLFIYQTQTMQSVKFKALLFAASVLGVTACQPEKSTQDTFQRINAEVLANSKAYSTLEQSTKEIGHRLTGSENGKKAEEFTYNLFRSYGFEDVQYQDFEVEAWSRGDVSLQIGKAGEMQNLPVVSLAHSPVKAQLEGEIVDLGNGLRADYEGKDVKDKIVLTYIGLLPGTEKGAHNLHRSEKAALAIENGAKGIIIINQVDGGVLLTGTASVTGSLLEIPAVCIGKEDGMALKERLANNEKLTAKIDMTNKSDMIRARNVIATLPGTEKPEEIIVVGGHLDSWDLSTGAIDNGIGSFAIIDIARTFKALDIQPKRTIQFVMFMGEEQGLLGSKAMLKQYAENGKIDQIKYMVNIDMSGNPVGFNGGGFETAETFFKTVAQKINAVDTTFTGKYTSRAGLHSDHQPFMLEGIPVASLMSNLDRKVYQFYHSDGDGFELVNKEHITNTVRFTSMMLHDLANAEQLPAQKLSSEDTKNMMVKYDLQEKLEIGGDWKWN